jgi:hypothetical protein
MRHGLLPLLQLAPPELGCLQVQRNINSRGNFAATEYVAPVSAGGWRREAA